MTPEQIQRAKAIVEYAAVNSLETEEVQLLGWALQHVAAQGKRLAELEAEGVVVPELTESDWGSLMNAVRPWNNRDFPASVFTEWVRSKARDIPSDRGLGEGEIGVPSDEVIALHGLERAVRGGHEAATKCILAHLDALRAQVGKDGAT